jgi:hypothetical protein
MSDRCVAAWGVPAAMVIAVGLMAPVPIAGQAPAPRAGASKGTATTKAWTPPRTADGQPDLQGVWLNNSATPLERPKELEGKQFLTDDEVTELKQRAARLFNSDADFPGGDNFFLAVLANPDHYKNPNATGGIDAMIERPFENRTSLIVDPPNGKIPWTPEGKRRQDAGAAAGLAAPAAGPEELTNAMRCTTYGVPRLGVAGSNAAGPLGYYQIVQAPGYVVLMLEAIHETRIIPLDGRPHLPERVRLWSGDSRGRWEGNTLVVESANFSPEGNVMGSGEHLHVVERFTRASPDTIDYEITLADPTTWTRPWTAVIHLKQSQATIYEYACHEGNLEVMHDILAGARAAERAAQGAVRSPK